MFKKKLIAATYVKDYLDDKRKFNSFDVQKLLLDEIMMINDISQDILDVYHYIIYSIMFLYCFISISLLT